MGKLLKAWFIFAFSNCIEAHAQTVAYLALGDSITAGTFSDASLLVPKNPDYFRNIKSSLYHAKGSWSTGTGIRSFLSYYAQYRRLSDQMLIAINSAIPGARVGSLQQQIETAAQILKGGSARLDLVTLWIGANDVCQKKKEIAEPSSEVFRAGLRMALPKILALASENAAIVVPTIPRIPDLGQERIMSHKSWYGLSCRTLHEKVLVYCRNLVNWKNQSEYFAAVSRVAAFNRIISEELANVKYLLRKAQKIHLTEPAVHEVFDVSFLSWDCFHPNYDGQEKIASLVWRQVERKLP